MIVEVINTGTELLLGDILNTNFQYLSKALNQKGFDVLYQTTVGDNEMRLREVLKIALTPASAAAMPPVNATPLASNGCRFVQPAIPPSCFCCAANLTKLIITPLNLEYIYYTFY